jgi:hypothetical protein
MWSLTSPHEGRTGGPEKFRSAVKEDFFNTIGTWRTWCDVRPESAMRPKSGHCLLGIPAKPDRDYERPAFRAFETRPTRTTSGPAVGYFAGPKAGCFGDSQVSWVVRWPGAKSAFAPTNCRRDS